MRRRSWAIHVLFALISLVAATAPASARSLPRIDGKEAVATVNGSPITLEELDRALGMRHSGMGEDRHAGKVSYAEVLNRLITIRLILLEARNIGLDELPEIREQVGDYSRGALMQVLLRQETKDVRAEGDELDALYRQLVKEYTLRSLLFEKEEDAKRTEEEIRSGKDFDEVARKAVAEGTAKGSEKGETIKPEALLPEIRSAVESMEAGSSSPVFTIKRGYVILKMDEIRYPEDPQAKEKAGAAVLYRKRAEAIDRYVKALKEQYVEMNREVLDALDYGAESPGFQAMSKDLSIVAEIRGEEPVTVGELSEAVGKKFFHGVEGAARKKRINEKKWDILDAILKKRVLRKEALRQGIDKSEPYNAMVREYEDSVLFEAFLQKVIRPGIRLEEKEMQAEYEKNLSEFSSPETMRIDGLVFARKDRAEEALRKLGEGTDFSWLGANAEGQVDRKTEDLLRFEGNLVVVASLPEDLQKVVSGAKSGDTRFYESPEGHYYVLSLREVIPPRPQPYETVREGIATRMVGEKMKREVEEYAGKLRNVYPVKIFLEDPKS